eukprot:GHUV01034120.1.p2 GENE.GHUV01034120.1~~GHUV01034120.1.p2  ORF type:complete len:131 (-),score=13.31 GHUV01034120.1:496-888(-)
MARNLSQYLQWMGQIPVVDQVSKPKAQKLCDYGRCGSMRGWWKVAQLNRGLLTTVGSMLVPRAARTPDHWAWNCTKQLLCIFCLLPMPTATALSAANSHPKKLDTLSRWNPSVADRSQPCLLSSIWCITT